MILQVIHNPADHQYAGFTQGQFRKLDQLFCLANAQCALTHRSVECDFDEGIASYTYYTNEQSPACLQFLIRKVGPRTTMFEVFKQGKGRIMKSGVFDRAFEALNHEIEMLIGNTV